MPKAGGSGEEAEGREAAVARVTGFLRGSRTAMGAIFLEVCLIREERRTVGVETLDFGIIGGKSDGVRGR